MRKTFKLALAATMGMFLLVAAPVAMAQDDPEVKIIPSIEYQQADVREALRALFKIVNVSYAIDPDVQGYINVSLKEVPFGTALQHILRQVDAVYQVQGGIYRIMRKPDDIGGVTPGTEPSIAPTNTKIVRRIKIRSADPMFIAAMLGTQGGNQDFQGAPERSTILKSGGMGGGGMGGFGGGGMGGMGGGMGGFGGGGMGGMGGGMGGFGGGMGGFGGGGMGGMGGGMGGFGGMGGGMGGRGGMGGGGGRGGFGG